jgi:hypothetical protein
MAKVTTRYVVVVDGKRGEFGMWVPRICPVAPQRVQLYAKHFLRHG